MIAVAKVLCYNLTVVARSVREFGIDLGPAFQPGPQRPAQGWLQ